MPLFGRRSRRILDTCHGDLHRIAMVVIDYYDFAIISGHRDEEEQRRLYDTGMSKVKYPQSKHNHLPSLAFDLAPYPIDWKDKGRFLVLAGRIMQVADTLGIKIRWGGDWDMDDDLNDQSFFDYGHYELLIDKDT